MNPGLVVKLRPTGPWRIGPDSGARNRVDTIYHSDTLYAAVTGALGRLGPLDEWLAATARNGEPAVCFSSCFPFLDEIGFIVPPRTVWPPTSRALLSARVRWKSARFVPLGIVQAILAGQTLDDNHWGVDAASECLVPAGRHGPFRTGMRSNAAVDRLSGAAERHTTACIEFRAGAGLWTIVSFSSEASAARWMDPVKTAFRLLADSGFGGERSRGWGRAEMPEFVEGVLPEMILPAIQAAAPPPPAPEPQARPEPEPPAPPPEAAPLAPAILPISVEAAEAELARMSAELPVPEPQAAVPEPPVEEPPAPEVPRQEPPPAEPDPDTDEPEPSPTPSEPVEEPEEPRPPVAEPPDEEEPSPEEPPSEEPAIHVAAAVAEPAPPAVEPPPAESPGEEPGQGEAAVMAPPVIQPLAAEPAEPETPPAAQPVPAPPAAPEPGAGHPHWLLSLFTPAPSDTVDWGRGSYSVIDRGGRIESPARSGELKKQLPMVTEGSVLYAAAPPRGSAPDVAPDGFVHPVYRAGFALSIPLPEVQH